MGTSLENMKKYGKSLKISEKHRSNGGKSSASRCSTVKNMVSDGFCSSMMTRSLNNGYIMLRI